MAISGEKRTAAVTFASARAAERRIAGLPAAARIVRELAEAGIWEVRLVVPRGEAIGRSAWQELRRLAGGAKVIAADAPGDAHVLLAGDRIIPAGCLKRDEFDRTAGIALDHRCAAKILRATAKASDGPVSRYINRPVSRFLSGLLLHIPGIRPMHATFGTALLAAMMLVCLIAGGEPGLIAGALLFQAASIFDGVDGEIARATFRSSQAGAVLDSTVDVITNAGFILGLAMNIGMGGSQAAFQLAGLGVSLFVVGLAIIAWRAARADGPFTLDILKHQYRRRFPGAASGAIVRFLVVVASRDFFALLFAILILAGLPMAVLALFTTTAVMWFALILLSLRLPVPGSADPMHREP